MSGLPSRAPSRSQNFLATHTMKTACSSFLPFQPPTQANSADLGKMIHITQAQIEIFYRKLKSLEAQHPEIVAACATKERLRYIQRFIDTLWHFSNILFLLSIQNHLNDELPALVAAMKTEKIHLVSVAEGEKGLRISNLSARQHQILTEIFQTDFPFKFAATTRAEPAAAAAEPRDLARASASALPAVPAETRKAIHITQVQIEAFYSLLKPLAQRSPEIADIFSTEKKLGYIARFISALSAFAQTLSVLPSEVRLYTQLQALIEGMQNRSLVLESVRESGQGLRISNLDARQYQALREVFQTTLPFAGAAEQDGKQGHSKKEMRSLIPNLQF